jgi:hypothetical protein
MIDLNIEYSFYPVGQGLFSGGVLSLTSPPNERSVPRFRWVYDCGTTSSQLFVRNAVGNLKANMGSERLDLIVISHFDTDHISGLVQLLNKVGTKTLMLPWASLAHRLIIAFEQSISPSDPEFGFYVDPVGYLKDAAPEGFHEIVFVGFGDEGGPEDPEDDGRPFDFDPDRGLKLKYEVDENEAQLAEVLFETNDANRSTNVSVLKSGSAVSIVGLWEFVPYNDPLTRPKSLEAFQRAVDYFKNMLLSADNDHKERALLELKNVYLDAFPKSQLNNLSLFLYGSPVGKWETIDGWYGHFQFHHHWRHDLSQYKASIIYTGDGNLSSAGRWDNLNSYLGSKRSYQPLIFQVPHHGSKKNWHDGLADILQPACSIFSSDPTHRGFGHPHGEVLRDFWGYNVGQVDKQHWFRIELLIRRQ